MKKVLFLAIALVAFTGYSQDSENPNDSSSTNSSFYIGVGAGLAFPGGDTYEDYRGRNPDMLFPVQPDELDAAQQTNERMIESMRRQ